MLANDKTRSTIYSTLTSGQIRLLTIRPGSFTDELCCDLNVVSLDTRPHYEALSYVWGDSSVTKLIELCSTPHPITVNLESALRHIRSKDEERKLWTDALCINQTDVTERGSQVAQMGYVYAYAERVLAWLGDPTEATDLAIDGIERLVSNSKLHWTRPRRLKSSIFEPEYFEAEKTFAGFVDLATRSWWLRVWIIQEALLARDLVFVCGKKTLRSVNFTRFIELYVQHLDDPGCCRDLSPQLPDNWSQIILDILPILVFRRDIVAETPGIPALDEDSNDPEQRSNRLGLIRAVDWGRDPKKDKYFRLLDQVSNYRARLCTDPRDKVYALLGLVSDLHDDLLPNYAVSCDEVYADFAYRVMCEQDNLDILTVLVPGQFEYSIPTWAPDWRYRTMVENKLIRPRTDDRKLYERFDNLCHFNAAGGRPCVIDRPSQLVLSVEGFVFDQVEFLSSYRLGFPHGSPGQLLWSNRLANIWNTDCGNCTPNMQTAIEAFLGYPRATGALLRRCKVYLKWQKFLSGRSAKFRKSLRAAQKTFVSNKTLRDWWDKADVFDEVVWLRRYAITRNDFVGFVPHSAQPGDKICILFGGRVPYILREIPENIVIEGIKYPKHVIVGDCYIHEFMQGEAVKMMEKGEAKRQKFFMQ